MDTITIQQISSATTTRRKIVDIATRIIETDGQEALSMRQLAQAIGLSPAALYKHFDGKEAILQAVRERALKRMAHAFAETEKLNGNPLDDVRTACRTLLTFAVEQPQLYSLIYERYDHTRPNYKEIFNTLHFRYMQKKLRQARKMDLLNLPPGFNEELLVLQLWTCIHGCVILRHSLMAGEAVFHEVSERMLNTMLDNLENPQDQWQVPRQADQ